MQSRKLRIDDPYEARSDSPPRRIRNRRSIIIKSSMSFFRTASIPSPPPPLPTTFQTEAQWLNQPTTAATRSPAD
ncbi:hypothetical protein LINPERPRIM_LOCUS15831 [Linum perenne]